MFDPVRLFFSCVSAIFLISMAGAAPDFEKDIAPILEANCLFCHNADEAKGDLNLATR